MQHAPAPGAWRSSTPPEPAPPRPGCRRYDADGKFVRRFIPALKAMPSKYIYEPWTAPLEVQRKAGCIIGAPRAPRPACLPGRLRLPPFNLALAPWAAQRLQDHHPAGGALAWP
jgi:hypothetical protein